MTVQEASLRNLLKAGFKKLRTCSCCGEDKPSKAFSMNGKKGTYVAYCRSCGNWLTLLRAAFGKTRDFEANRERTRLRMKTVYEAKAAARRVKPNEHTTNLFTAWYGERNVQPDSTHTGQVRTEAPAQGS